MMTNLFGQFHAVYIPQDKLSFMKMDGDTSDWNWVPENYFITEESMKKVLDRSSGAPEENWKCEIKVAWNEIENKIFILAKVFDDVLINQTTDFGKNDCMQFVVDAMNNGGWYDFSYQGGWSYSRDQYHCLKGHIFVNKDLTIRVGPKWLEKNSTKYIKWGVNSAMGKDGYVAVYEICMSLWDKWSVDPEHSKQSDLHPNKKIRLLLGFQDVDTYNRLIDRVTFSGVDWFKDADEISQFVLDAPVEKEVTWNNIRYLLKPE